MQFSLDIRFNNTWKKFIAVERIKFQVYVIHFVSHSTRKFVMINFFIFNSTRTFRRRQHDIVGKFVLKINSIISIPFVIDLTFLSQRFISIFTSLEVAMALKNPPAFLLKSP